MEISRMLLAPSIQNDVFLPCIIIRHLNRFLSHRINTNSLPNDTIVYRVKENDRISIG